MNKNFQNWQLVFNSPHVAIGIKCDENFITQVDYIPPSTLAINPQNLLAAECKNQLQSYFKSPRSHSFSLPLLPAKTPHAIKLRHLLQSIPPGKTLTYGQVALALKHSSARAIGSGCRTNPIALIVPCHRVVAANGIGGFMGHSFNVNLKKVLLQLEGAL